MKVIPWQPKNPKTGEIVHRQVEAYEDFIRRYRGKLDWCAFIDMDEYLYCRPGLSVGGILEKMGRVVMKGWKFRMRWGMDGLRTYALIWITCLCPTAGKRILSGCVTW